MEEQGLNELSARLPQDVEFPYSGNGMYHPQLAAGDRIWTQSACRRHLAAQEVDEQLVIFLVWESFCKI